MPIARPLGVRVTAAQTYDYVIVGAGSAGAVLANCLSADPGVTVCLIEAGPSDASPFIAMPLGLVWLAKDKKHNWLFQTAPQAGLGGRRVSLPRGKVLGGSSSINGMIYIRGHRDDYDDWARAGCTGWDFDSVLPFFKRSEANADPTKDEEFHGRDGLLSVDNQRDPSSLGEDFIEAAGRLQMRPCGDFNTPEPEGVGIYQVTQKDGKRHSTAAAFLRPAERRDNLVILTGAEVHRVLIENRRATGVALHHDNRDLTISARAEVVLSGGAIGSPDILLRSGVGPGAQIKSFGGEVVHDLPGVGENLHDHVDAMVICKSRSITPYGISVRALPRLTGDALKWVFARRGMLTSNMVESGGFVRSSPAEDRPDIQFHLIPGRKSHRGRMLEYGHGVSLHTCVLRPKSRGRLTRDTPGGAPSIDLGLLTHDDDAMRLVKGVKMAREILAQEQFTRHGLNEILPGDAAQDDDAIEAFVRTASRTVHHPVGTCAMGTGPDAVVSPRLRVHGIDGLRVVDASIMPSIVSGNTNAPTIMIAEKAAQMIQEERSA